MLKIERLRIEIVTSNGVYGIDESFQGGLNIIASHVNTCGKSSILAAIYYCLGFEQIIGGVGGIGMKVLTSAFKTTIEDDGKNYSVIESGAYLQISNGFETRTIYRNIKSESMDNRLVTVFFGDYDSIHNYKTVSGDYYVNVPNSATSEKGFHTFLEEFLHMELPMVQSSDGNERKLYLQLIFAAMFIEQKHGWSDILSGMPIFGIKESKKRVVEYVLGLNTLKNARERDLLKAEKTKIEQKWEQLVIDVKRQVRSESCEISNLPIRPKVLLDSDISRIVVLSSNDRSIEEEIQALSSEYSQLHQLKPLVRDNFEALNRELSETQVQILSFETRLSDLQKNIVAQKEVTKHLNADLEIINADIRNNNDAARLQKYGSEAIGADLSVSVCPVCKQHIQDSLLTSETTSCFMSIEANLRHLKEQKKMLEFSLGSRKETLDKQSQEKQLLETRLQSLRRLAYTLRSDLFTTTETEASESIMLKRIEITNRTERLKKLKAFIDDCIEQLKQFSFEWGQYLNKKSKLPKKDISEADSETIALFKKRFIENLKRYHYSSLSSFDGIDISMDSSLLPTVDGFDMKFDSSASDGIRAIWAFTMALLQVSIERDGNHPSIVIFDEPDQQSIVPEDMKSFIQSIVEICKPYQIITAITLNSKDLIDIIDKMEPSCYHKIMIEGKKAFKRLS